MADNFMTYNDAVDVLTPYAEKINTIKPEPITWAAYQLLTTAQKEAKRYIITDYPSPDGNVDKLSELEDVDIDDQTLANNQVPVYNSTTEKWENKSILENSLTSTATDKALTAAKGKELQDNKQDKTLTTPLTINGTQETTVEGALGGLNDYGDVLAENLAANEESGAKNQNVYPYSDTTKTENGLIFTDNGDGTITVSAASYPYTVPTDTHFICHNFLEQLSLEQGDYILSGSPIVSNDIYVTFVYYDNGYIGVDSKGADQPFYLPLKTNNETLRVFFRANSVITETLLFKPMIRDARILDDTFVPYAPTNRELMSYKANGKVGAKNLLPYPYHDTTKTENAVTFTDNGDGTVEISGTASANANFSLHNYASRDFFLSNGTYKLGTTNYLSGMYVGVAIHNQDGTMSYYDTLFGEAQITINGSYDTPSGAYVEISINVYSGVSITTPITVKPMIRIAEDTDPNYQPYAMTNRQLTERFNNDFLIKSFNIPSGSIQPGAYAEVVSAQDIAVAGYELISVCYYALGSYSGTLICQFLIQGNNPRIELFNAGANASDPEGIIKCTYKKTT